MSSSRDRRRKIFETARELSDQERAGFLDEACGGDPELRGEEESLLQAERDAGSLLSGKWLGAALDAALFDDDSLLGRTVGRYRVVEVIARGGMGVVYRAEQKKRSWPERQAAERFPGWDPGRTPGRAPLSPPRLRGAARWSSLERHTHPSRHRPPPRRGKPRTIWEPFGPVAVSGLHRCAGG